MSDKKLQKKVKLINDILGEQHEKFEMEYCEFYGYVLTYQRGSIHLRGRLSKKKFSGYLDGIIQGLSLVGFD